MQLLEHEGVRIRARILSIGTVTDSAPFDAPVAGKPFPAVSDGAATTMQEEIAQALYLNKSSVARQIACLEKQELVYRKPSPDDRRRLLVYPTEKALSMLPLLVETVRGWNDYLLDGMDADERAQLEAIMERISARARAYIEREVGWDG